MKAFFKLLTALDWISPAVAILEDANHGLNMNSWTFYVDWPAAEDSGWAEITVRQALEGYGVESWGYLLYGDELMFKVNLGQAQLAEWVMNLNGIPITERGAGAPKVR